MRLMGPVCLTSVGFTPSQPHLEALWLPSRKWPLTAFAATQAKPLCPSCLWSGGLVSRPLRPGSWAGFQLSRLLYLMTSPDWWFEAEQDRTFLWAPAWNSANPAERGGPENKIHLDVRFFYGSGWKVPPWKSVPELKCFKMHLVEWQLDRKMQTIPSSETNYRSFNKGILWLEKRGPWPRTWWGILAAWDQPCVVSCFTSLARLSSRHLEWGRAQLELITHSRTVQDSDLIVWCEAIRALLPEWVRIWKWAWWWNWCWLF